MVIDEFDVDGLTVLEREDQSPIAGHPHGPLPLSVPLELMQPMGGRIHIFRPFRGVKRSQQATDLGGALNRGSHSFVDLAVSRGTPRRHADVALNLDLL